ncbi:uncharacterized protein TRIADDRAFT_26575 [Trichoplax adhaerens]|uniref:DNA primase n=1 Tax=Trichoplax adhaerens TaxID=10228 RepID=B3RZA4_TRIAD|nr:hypothetical protein TRIADDRAFT_26575 [Trichoplax adhaerens]EDV23807.1 hypothetical protein TRIADDRAFT_26575 [Trichoplax adhaerens]|eukprot:XP_002113333.1 hypothetical protein TRIADDRAFT_26575 [Trichoplax adhaerens]
MEGNKENTSTLSVKYDLTDLPQLMAVYYKRLFPYQLYYKWLSYGNVSKNYFANREFSFTLKDDIYVRYLSFSDKNEMQKEIQKRSPYKIDLGAVYSFRPKDRNMIKNSSFQPEEKELVFDIDMTDYDEIRSCCSGAEICSKCWPFMTVAMKILDAALREDFGFHHLLWVYSGRRGIHCWVCDAAARKLSQSARSAIAEYLTIIKGGEGHVKRVHFKNQAYLHPSIQRALKTIESYFEDLLLKKQNILESEESSNKVLALIPDKNILKDQIRFYFFSLSEEWNNSGLSSLQKWSLLKQKIEKDIVSTKNSVLTHCVAEIQLQYTYPRLDINVSKGINHLLKSPFCIHPKTGRVCVPIPATDIDNFDPFSVPNICHLCSELDDSDSNIEKNSEEGDTNSASC